MGNQMGLDLRVLERNSSVATAYCGRLLAMLGADVSKVEADGGDPMRSCHPRIVAPDGHATSALFEYLNCFKHSTVFSDSPGGQQALEATLEAADCIIDYVD